MALARLVTVSRALAAVVTSTALTFACASKAPPAASPATAVDDTTAAAEPGTPASPVAPPQPLPAPPYGTPEQLATWVDGYVSALGKDGSEAERFNGYIAISRGGAVAFGKGYGKANKATGALADVDTRFRLGSLTKQFTAVALMQLAERGALKLDAPIGDFVPGLSKPIAAVTLHQLATHTSGILNYTRDASLMRDQAAKHPPAEVIASFNDRPLAFTPGSKFEYSNSNYFLLGLVIEKVSGSTYETYLQSHVLAPAGMARSSTIDAPDAPNTAVGYDGESGTLKETGPFDMSLPFAAGALRSTANDLIAWDRALTGELLLKGASKERLFTPDKQEYAYGVGVHTRYGHVLHEHNGGIPGFSTYFARLPDLGLAVVVLGNNEAFDSTPLGETLVTIVAKGEAVAPPPVVKTTPIDAPLMKRVLGEYTLTPSGRADLSTKLPPPVLESIAGLSVTREGDRLFMKPSGQSRLELFRDEAGVLFTKTSGIRLAVTGDGVALLQAGMTMPYVRAKKPSPSAKPKTKAPSN